MAAAATPASSRSGSWSTPRSRTRRRCGRRGRAVGSGLLEAALESFVKAGDREGSSRSPRRRTRPATLRVRAALKALAGPRAADWSPWRRRPRGRDALVRLSGLREGRPPGRPRAHPRAMFEAASARTAPGVTGRLREYHGRRKDGRQVQVTVRYFALLRERAGVDAEVVAWEGRRRTSAPARAPRRRAPALAELLRSGALLVP